MTMGRNDRKPIFCSVFVIVKCTLIFASVL